MEALVAIVAATLAVAGVAKVVEPLGARQLLHRVGLPSGRVLVRLLGAVEVVVAVTALVEGGRVPAALLALTHLGFAAVVLAARRGGDVACGCFGSRSTAPPGPLHLVANLASVVVAVVAVVDPVRPSDLLTRGTVGGALAALATVAVGAWLLIVVYTDGAELAHAVRRVAADRVERAPRAAIRRGHR